jgi:protein gp37
MAEHSTIEWTDHTWSPWIGCTKVSPACDGCYAEHLMDTRLGRVAWGPHGERSRTSTAYWRKPLAWNREAQAAGRMLRVFPSLCDPFDNQADPAVRREWFDLIRATPHLLWLLLTKRPQNAVAMSEAAGGLPGNVALGTTCEDQERANRNVRHLLDAARDLRPAFTFVSAEPLLGPIDFTRIVYGQAEGYVIIRDALADTDIERIDWVITGGETDQGAHRARPSHPDWYRAIRDACAEARVPYLHKQNGEWATTHPDWPRAQPTVMANDGTLYQPADLAYPDGARYGEAVRANHDKAHLTNIYRVGKKAAGRLLDGVEHNGMPEVRL